MKSCKDKKNFLFLCIGLLVISALIASGCIKPKESIKRNQKTQIQIGPENNTRYHNFTKNGKSSDENIEKTRESVANAVKKYFETAFLDLELARSNGYSSAILEFFSEQEKTKNDKNFNYLTLGKDANNIDSITSNKLLIPNIAIQYKENKKPALSTAQFHFEVEYNADEKSVKMTTIGWLSMEKIGDDWKIFNYWTQQTLRTQKENDQG